MTTIFANADIGIIGLLFFLTIFVIVVVWALAPSRKHSLESYKYIPLAEDK